MPCDSGPSYPQMDSLGYSFDAYAKILCALCTALEKNPKAAAKLLRGDTPVAQWWKDHKELDRKRAQKDAAAKQKEKLAREARRKLTAAERKALEIDD